MRLWLKLFCVVKLAAEKSKFRLGSWLVGFSFSFYKMAPKLFWYIFFTKYILKLLNVRSAVSVTFSSVIKMLHFQRYLNRVLKHLTNQVLWTFCIKLVLKVSEESVTQVTWKTYLF